jgi:hypothetical protein
MSLSLQLQALLVPFGTEFPGTVQDLMYQIQQYMEVTGAGDFSGVNYGSSEPAPEDRDKAWFRTDGSGNVLGWYYWDGGAWTVLPGKAFVGDVAARDAISHLQDGLLFQVLGTGLYVFSTSDNAWQPSFPAAITPQTYDKNYYFDSYQLLVAATGDVSSWTPIDLSLLIDQAGIASPKAALIALESGFGQTAFPHGGTDYAVDLRVTQDNTVSTSSNSTPHTFARGSADDSRTSAWNNSYSPVPLPSSQTLIYYNVQTNNAPPGATANVWLVGFVY